MTTHLSLTAGGRVADFSTFARVKKRGYLDRSGGGEVHVQVGLPSLSDVIWRIWIVAENGRVSTCFANDFDVQRHRVGGVPNITCQCYACFHTVRRCYRQNAADSPILSDLVPQTENGAVPWRSLSGLEQALLIVEYETARKQLRMLLRFLTGFLAFWIRLSGRRQDECVSAQVVTNRNRPVSSDSLVLSSFFNLQVCPAKAGCALSV